MIQFGLRTPIDISLMRPYWYDSDEEHAGSEYDTDEVEEEEDASPRSVTWTNQEAVEEVREYLEDKLIDCEEIEDVQTFMALGTWSALDNIQFMSIKLDVAAYLKWGALYTRHFGYLHETWNEERPYDIMKVHRALSDGFIEYRAVIKTHWLRLIQRHWINRGINCGLRGLLASYK